MSSDIKLDSEYTKNLGRSKLIRHKEACVITDTLKTALGFEVDSRALNESQKQQMIDLHAKQCGGKVDVPLSPVVTTSVVVVATEERTDLSELTLDDLASRYSDIDKQSQLMKGMILLAARERFPSDKEFGKWVSTVGLSDSSTYQTRSDYMNLARFFKNRTMTGISNTSAIEISRPGNADIAEIIYAQALNANLSVKDVKQLIEKEKPRAIKETKTDKPEMMPSINENNVKELLRLAVNGVPTSLTIRLLKELISELEKVPSPA